MEGGGGINTLIHKYVYSLSDKYRIILMLQGENVLIFTPFVRSVQINFMVSHFPEDYQKALNKKSVLWALHRFTIYAYMENMSFTTITIFCQNHV